MADLPSPSNDAGLSSLFVQLIYWPAAGLFGQLGLTSPTSRAIVGGILGYAFQEIVRPTVSWGDEDWNKNTPLPWYGLARKQKDNEKIAYTMFPWWAWPASGAFALGMLF